MAQISSREETGHKTTFGNVVVVKVQESIRRTAACLTRAHAKLAVEQGGSESKLFIVRTSEDRVMRPRKSIQHGKTETPAYVSAG